MALNWDLTAVAEVDAIKDGAEWLKTRDIIFGCMATGIGTITEKNYVEWFVRYALWNKLNGYEVGITVQDVARRIGLKTNVGSSDELESRWIAKQLKPILNEMRVKAKQEMAG